jgi:hypothetical protein
MVYPNLHHGYRYLPNSEAEVLDEPYSAKPAQQSSYTGPPGYIGWTRFQPMLTGGPVRQLRWVGVGLADCAAGFALLNLPKGKV